MTGIRELMKQERERRKREAEQRNNVAVAKNDSHAGACISESCSDLETNEGHPLKRRRSETEHHKDHDGFENNNEAASIVKPTGLPVDFFDVSPSDAAGSCNVRLPHDPIWISNAYEGKHLQLVEEYFIESDASATPEDNTEELDAHHIEESPVLPGQNKAQIEELQQIPSEDDTLTVKRIPDDFFDTQDATTCSLNTLSGIVKRNRFNSQLKLFNKEIQKIEEAEDVNEQDLDLEPESLVSPESESRLMTLHSFLQSVKQTKLSKEYTSSSSSTYPLKHDHTYAHLAPFNVSDDEISDEASDHALSRLDKTMWRNKTLRK